jgi:hypothetical protein
MEEKIRGFRISMVRVPVSKTGCASSSLAGSI